MKTKIFLGILFLFVISASIFAQSDYETVQNFKRQHKQIVEAIKNAVSPDDCNIIEEKINNLRNEFEGNKALLDKALYPDNFESSFEKIESAFQSKRTDLAQINILTTQVGTLQEQVLMLNQKNEDLMKRISDLTLKSEKDQADIANLKKLVSQLRGNINQRDLLVRDLVDSLLVEFIKSPEEMTQKERRVIITKINKGNLFNNIKRTIEDNIRFTNVTQMTADDFSKMKKQQRNFDKVWKQIGPRLSSVYLKEKNKKLEISQIDTLFVQWNNQMNNEIWRSIHSLFMEKNINLISFNNSNQFVDKVCSFIDEQIKDLDVKSTDESEEIFHTFTDSVYFKTVEKKWIPVLLENNMMTQTEKDLIDGKINEWKNEITPSYAYLGFIIVGVIIIAAVLYAYKKTKKASSKPVTS
ncbi:MAG: hypothetical protein A2279_11015 [Stygiobacter sp. RIFOXYA12_FULL_38_9]|nr:MAG: hypothetical protein A2X62_13070 [Stygiobacter sp. GWC2_38_9]OGU78805.1 MAG: hypothetical protein A2279_11015 [Stygiobacter sp. RIFOXYA12_FULL_38_9]OGV07535.1 MAG: hypothetical protein A2299_18210 [Stygiobacter sp. RIFOXYB2_FULL_37_11]OGV11945.1 MAG: hypothetical protein A2237_08370 [Stygiobacter sp. RIFOXYA2_FULL_38_8]OGV13796.1 MAG: hypothetical protein A2440_11610 [Stygiobacter sp. RIFOXYC2_FULL_38_25]OGV80180.1 MAG: hypothetical protein A2X65_03560 [Stygiobacter sp. GWF2_38_21]OGV